MGRLNKYFIYFNQLSNLIKIFNLKVNNYYLIFLFLQFKNYAHFNKVITQKYFLHILTQSFEKKNKFLKLGNFFLINLYISSIKISDIWMFIYLICSKVSLIRLLYMVNFNNIRLNLRKVVFNISQDFNTFNKFF